MKIWAISDLHLSFACDKPMDIFGGAWPNHTEKIEQNWEKLISQDDYVLLGGDISWGMTLEEAKADLDWIDKLPGKKVMIKGNHEYWWKSISAVRAILPQSIKAIQNDCIRIADNVLVCGTRGWTVPEHGKKLEKDDKKLYNRETERLKLSLAAMEKERKADDTVICMIHYPPYNMKKEDSDFTKLLEEHNVDKVIFGHLHGKIVNMEKVLVRNNISYYFTATDHIDNTPVLIYEN